MPKPITYAQFHEAAGSAVAAWAAVEDAFCDLFTRLVICSVTGGGMVKATFDHFNGYRVVSGIFYASTNWRARIDLTTRIFNYLIQDESLKAEMASVVDKARDLHARRNVLAHGHVWGGSQKGAQFIAYSMFDETKRRQMSYQQVCAATPSFKRFRDRVEQLSINANKYLAARREGGAQNPAD